MIWNRDRDAGGEPFWHLGRIGDTKCLYIFRDERGYCPALGIHFHSLDDAKSWHLKNTQLPVD